jgi:hypothetical protein
MKPESGSLVERRHSASKALLNDFPPKPHEVAHDCGSTTGGEDAFDALTQGRRVLKGRYRPDPDC